MFYINRTANRIKAVGFNSSLNQLGMNGKLITDISNPAQTEIK